MAHGYFKWHDLITPDAGASTSFYQSLFDWELEPSERDGSDAPTIVAGGRRAASIVDAAPGTSLASWLSYLKVDDVDTSARVVVEAGGTILTPAREVPHLGRVIVCEDIHGAVFALLTPPRGPKATMMIPGSFCWHELVTPAIDQSEAFYTKVASWGPRIEYNVEGVGLYREFTGEVAGLGSWEATAPDALANWTVFFASNDADQTVEAARLLGASVLAEPVSLPGIGRYALLRDPLGARFAVLSLPSDEPRRLLWAEANPIVP